jgi:hypothetical protein
MTHFAPMERHHADPNNGPDYPAYIWCTTPARWYETRQEAIEALQRYEGYNDVLNDYFIVGYDGSVTNYEQQNIPEDNDLGLICYMCPEYVELQELIIDTTHMGHVETLDTLLHPKEATDAGS